MSISVSNLLKLYGEQRAVNNISFEVNKGEIVGFLGPNGAGKSTTMKIITGFLSSDKGEVKICGKTTAENSIESKSKIGYLPEANPLYFDMYVKEYLEFIAGVHNVADVQKRIEEVIAMTGLLPEKNKKAGQLSKGYKQRLGLAAALIHDPEVLILDEPTSGLDPNQIIEIRNLIKDLGKEKAVLLSTHIMQEVMAVCDRAIIINKGKIVADSPVKSLGKGMDAHAIVLMQVSEPLDKKAFEGISKHFTSAALDEKGYWRFETTQPDVLKKALMQKSLENNWNITSIQSETQNLEAIFKKLTNK